MQDENDPELWWAGETVEWLQEDWDNEREDRAHQLKEWRATKRRYESETGEDYPEPRPVHNTDYMTFLPQDGSIPPGVRVLIQGKDQWGKRRKLQQTFRPIPEDLVNDDEWGVHPGAARRCWRLAIPGATRLRPFKSSIAKAATALLPHSGFSFVRSLYAFGAPLHELSAGRARGSLI